VNYYCAWIEMGENNSTKVTSLFSKLLLNFDDDRSGNILVDQYFSFKTTNMKRQSQWIISEQWNKCRTAAVAAIK